MYIYVLKCDGDKYYIGKTSNRRNLNIRLRQHQNPKTRSGAAWTRLHQPVEVVNTFQTSNKYDELSTTLKYMQEHGVENVRGASYSQVVLNPFQLQQIEREFRSATDRCLHCGEAGHFASMCPKWLPELYVLQKCAGGGKSYEIIQMLGKSERFRTARRFIILTKVHSAKDNLHEKYETQIQDNVLKVREDSNNDRGRRISRQGEQTCEGGGRFRVDICTVDSFLCGAGRKIGLEPQARNQMGAFEALANDISVSADEGDGVRVRNIFRCPIDRKTLVVVDEAQDLSYKYLNALVAMMCGTGFRLLLVGDLMQSIQGEANAMRVIANGNTYMWNKHQISITRIIQPAKSYRFERAGIMSFVNKVCPNKRYGVELFQSMHHQEFESSLPPVNVFTDNTKCRDPNCATIKWIEKEVLPRMEREIQSNGHCLPSDFLFVHPLVNNNEVLCTIQSRLEEFWSKMLKRKEVQEMVRKREATSGRKPHWSNPEMASWQTVMLHRSCNGSIEIRDSVYMTRIMSVHAAKGLDANVVFCLGLSDNVLHKFTTDHKRGLVYWSMAYVALTRAKRALYVALQPDSGFIGRQLCGACDSASVDIDSTTFKEQSLVRVKSSTITRNDIMTNIVRYLPHNTDEDENEPIHILLRKIEEEKQDTPDNRKLVEWGDHCLRLAALNSSIRREMLASDRLLKKHNVSQLGVVASKIRGVKNTRVFRTTREYYDALERISNNTCNTFPLQRIRDTTMSPKLLNAVGCLIRHVALKFRKERFPRLCPLEAVVYVHMEQVFLTGKYIAQHDVRQLYRVVDSFLSNYSGDHDEYNCLCSDHSFKQRGKVDSKLCHHYNATRDRGKHHIESLLALLSGPDHKTVRITLEWALYLQESDYKLRYNSPPIIARTDDTAYLIFIRPTADSINVYELYQKSLVATFMLRSCAKTAVEGKNGYKLLAAEIKGLSKLKSVWLTLSHPGPLFFEHDEHEFEGMRGAMQTSLECHYRDSHEGLALYYDACIENNGSKRNQTKIFKRFAESVKGFLKNRYRGKRSPPEHVIDTLRDIDRGKETLPVDGKQLFALLEHAASLEMKRLLREPESNSDSD